MRADREAAAAERAAMMARLASMPALMRERQQWLLWRFEQHAGEPKPRKVPYYVNGKRRMGKQGDEADRASLASFEAVAARLRGSLHWSGLGFAFLPGDGLVGVDIDGAVDPESGEVSALCLKVIDLCASYTEYSPSGKGVHIIVAGETKTAKDDGIGLEVFCGSQYFTCTGRWWPGAAREVRAIGAEALAELHAMVEAGKAASRARRTGGAAVPVAVAGLSAPAPAGRLSAWLDQALQVLDPNCSYSDWIGIGMALKSALGDAGFTRWDYWSSKAGERYAGQVAAGKHWASFKGTDADGALTIFKMARKGNKWRPPDDYLAVYGGDGEKARIARQQRGAEPLRLVASQPPPDGGELASDERPEPPTPPEEENGSAADAPGGRRRSPRKRPPLDEGGRGVVDRLLEHFALLYGTDTVWDGERRAVMQVKNLRLLFSGPLVNAWLAHPMRRLVYPEQLMFEPGVELPDDHVNLFDGFALQPQACTEDEVRPMLDLGRHLCSLSARTPEGVEAVWQQVLCWLALPIQRPGAKLRFALVFHGPQGTGKNLFFDTVRAVYGKYGRMVGQTELEDRFNGYMSGKLMLIGNEVVTRQELFHNKNKLKWVITEDQIPIRGMHQEVRWESNHANLVFLSNELQPVALEKDDRRHLVVYTPAADDEDLYLRVADFLARGGAAKFMHYLLHEVDTEGFTEFTKPLMTEAKDALIELGLKPAERFVNEWLEGLLPLPLQVCSAEQLYRVFRRWAEMNGERFVPPQATFTKQVERHVFERVERDPVTKERLAPRLAYKIVGLKPGEGPRKSVRCWLPAGTGPANGVTEGEWAAACVDAFEHAAHRFGRQQAEVDE